MISMDPTADITDTYAFRSWQNPDKAVLIMNVIPQQVPAGAPNFYNLDDDVTYAFLSSSGSLMFQRSLPSRASCGCLS